MRKNAQKRVTGFWSWCSAQGHYDLCGAGLEVKLILGVIVSTSDCLSLFGGSVELATHPRWTPVQGGQRLTGRQLGRAPTQGLI